MSRKVSRIRSLGRTLTFLRQQLGWKKLRQSLGATGLSPVIIEGSAPEGETVLVLAPHPDDEAFGCGGALAWQAEAGAAITVIFLSSGEGGGRHQEDNRALARQREGEARVSVAVVNGQAEFWRQPDGNITPQPTLVQKLAARLTELKPTRIYTPWLADNHPDHMNTTELLAEALKLSKIEAEVWQYEIWSPTVPNRFLPLKNYLGQKEKMINCHQSQLTQRNYKAGILGLNGYRGLQAAVDGPAEAFFVLPAGEFVKLVGGRTLLG